MLSNVTQPASTSPSQPGACQQRFALASCRSTSAPDADAHVVFGEPVIKIFLQIRDRAVELLAECNAVELIEQRLVEALANAVSLRAPRLSARVIDVLYREVELIFVALRLAAKFRAPVGKHATDDDLMLLEERHHPIVHQVGSG